MIFLASLHHKAQREKQLIDLIINEANLNNNDDDDKNNNGSNDNNKMNKWTNAKIKLQTPILESVTLTNFLANIRSQS